MSVSERLRGGIAAMGLAPDDRALELYARHLALVEKWNRVHNLTAVRDPEQMVTVHVLDSLALLPSLGDARRIVDVGTGAGFPGIVIAIADPSRHVTLLDASHKKATFLEQAKSELRLDNATVICARVQDYKPAEAFDAVVSRAFADLQDFVAQGAHLVAPGGRMLAMKGVYPYEEIARVPSSHRVANVEELHVPALDAKRHVVRIEVA